MPRRPAITMTAALAVLAALGGIGTLAWAQTAKTPGARSPGHVAFQIATGASEGAYFSVGQTIAGLVSHAPGVDRCEDAGVCGPSGLIISARTSDGAIDNLREINSGTVDSGLAPADAVGAAVKGTGIFARRGKLGHLRILAALFTENVQLVVAAKSKIARVADLSGKRVSLGPEESGGGLIAREILAAWHLPEARLHVLREARDGSIALMRAGKLDAFFVIGGAPDSVVADLVHSGTARVVAIDGAGRTRLLRRSAGLAPALISAGTYSSSAVQTVSTRAVWVVRDTAPDMLIYGMTRALFNPSNRALLAASYPSAQAIGPGAAARDPAAPLHPGAARYYRETGALPKTN